MDFRKALRRLAAWRLPSDFPSADAAYPEREGIEEELIEVQTVRECIAKVVSSREAHALLVSLKETEVRELNELMEERAGVQRRLAAREKEIALAGGELPNEPFPEEAEITRLNRHVRIRQERVRGCESKVSGWCTWRTTWKIAPTLQRGAQSSI
ncbi:MAG TPA: hypothetical protein VLY04_22235 [Bryobacteraceae bacterium]|nr:hypothetical protein [Bryobacteraceae bacterium]